MNDQFWQSLPREDCGVAKPKPWAQWLLLALYAAGAVVAAIALML